MAFQDIPKTTAVRDSLSVLLANDKSAHDLAEAALTCIPLSAGQDANTLLTDNALYTWAAGAVIGTGSNWPAGVAAVGGTLQVHVMSPGNVVQTLTLRPAGGRRPVTYQRGTLNGVWGAWAISSTLSSAQDLPSADCGDAYVDKIGWYTWSNSGYVRSSLAKVLLPIPGHDLNLMDIPGSYVCNVSADATPERNFPIPYAGMLVVEASPATNLQVVQTYTTMPVGKSLTYRRVRFGLSKVWEPWSMVPRIDQVVKRIALPANGVGVDANTLQEDNTIYTWVSYSTILDPGGANWPPVHNATVGAGFMEVFYVTAGLVVQRCTLLVEGHKPRIFERFGYGSIWESWKIISSLSSTSYLPVKDAGDVYVDGFGWCRWSAANNAYTGENVATGVFKLGQGSTFYGSFTGNYAPGISTVFQDNTGPTYVTAVPGSGGAYAGFLARARKQNDTQFLLMGINRDSGIGNILFSSHGTAALPLYMTIDSATGECGRIIEDGRWQFGRYILPNVYTAVHINYSGAGDQYGMVLRPRQAADSVAIQFQASNGAACGYIYAQNTLSVIYSTTSDYRSKKVLRQATPEESLARVMALRPVWYRMNGAPDDSPELLGFVAHELQEHISQAVTGCKDEMHDMGGERAPKMQGVDFSKIVPDLVATIQAQQRQISALISRLERVEALAA